MQYQYQFTIKELNSLIKLMKRVEKIIQKSEYLNKWYEAGHIRLLNIGEFPVVEVWRMKPDSIITSTEGTYMDKGTKDNITSYLKKNKFVYFEAKECYIYNPFIK